MNLKLKNAIQIITKLDSRFKSGNRSYDTDYIIVPHKKPIQRSEIQPFDIFVLPNQDKFMEIYIFDGPYIIGGKTATNPYGSREATEEEFNHFKKGVHLRHHRNEKGDVYFSHHGGSGRITTSDNPFMLDEPYPTPKTPIIIGVTNI